MGRWQRARAAQNQSLSVSKARIRGSGGEVDRENSIAGGSVRVAVRRRVCITSVGEVGTARSTASVAGVACIGVVAASAGSTTSISVSRGAGAASTTVTCRTAGASRSCASADVRQVASLVTACERQAHQERHEASSDVVHAARCSHRQRLRPIAEPAGWYRSRCAKCRSATTNDCRQTNTARSRWSENGAVGSVPQPHRRAAGAASSPSGVAARHSRARALAVPTLGRAQRLTRRPSSAETYAA